MNDIVDKTADIALPRSQRYKWFSQFTRSHLYFLFCFLFAFSWDKLPTYVDWNAKHEWQWLRQIELKDLPSRFPKIIVPKLNQEKNPVLAVWIYKAPQQWNLEGYIITLIWSDEDTKSSLIDWLYDGFRKAYYGRFEDVEQFSVFVWSDWLPVKIVFSWSYSWDQVYHPTLFPKHQSFSMDDFLLDDDGRFKIYQTTRNWLMNLTGMNPWFSEEYQEMIELDLWSVTLLDATRSDIERYFKLYR